MLLLKSNCALFEWLGSPAVYRENPVALQLFRDVAAEAFLPISAFHHYFSLARGKLRDLAESSRPRVKTYLYALRAMLCCRHVVEFRQPPPVEFSSLLQQYLPDGEIRAQVDSQIHRKQSQSESASFGCLGLIDDYLELQQQELSQQEAVLYQNQRRKPAADSVDRAFARTLSEVHATALEC